MPYISEKEFALEELARAGGLYEAVFMNLGRLLWLSDEAPEVLDVETVKVLCKVLDRAEHASRKQSYFLYRKAGQVLAKMVSGSPDESLRARALVALRDLTVRSGGVIHRCVAGAAGELPLDLPRPVLGEAPKGEPPRISWERLKCLGGVNGDPPQVLGRSLVFDIRGKDLFFVVKCAREPKDLESLRAEALWMRRLGEQDYPAPFSVPRPLGIRRDHVAVVEGLPRAGGNGGQDVAMAFFAPPEYYRYPNEPAHGEDRGLSGLLEDLEKSALLLGHLAGRGMVHVAPIPLFHNRVQAHRRNDRGIYEWPRAGRLDQWLASCKYPNFGAAGVRDFEHMEVFSGNMRDLYLHLGTHVLGLVLVTASYFRNLEPHRVGHGPDGVPVDARVLFDRPFFSKALLRIFQLYFKGFTGSEYRGPIPWDLDALARALIDKMGVDTDMEEILRVHDQQRLTRPEFEAFLVERGVPAGRARAMEQGKEDISVHTGPHLGEFNGTISTPELTEYVATSASLCVAGRYGADNCLDATF